MDEGGEGQAGGLGVDLEDEGRGLAVDVEGEAQVRVT